MGEFFEMDTNNLRTTNLFQLFMSYLNPKKEKICPSRYTYEMQMSVEERLNVLNARSESQRSRNRKEPWAHPDIVIFQNFETHVKYTTIITFMHQMPHSVRIKVSPQLSPCFTLHELAGTVYSKLAPGTPHKMQIDFYSEEPKDYLSVIKFEADEATVYLPILALAPCSILIFPDIIEIPETVVNVPSEKKVSMKNIGKKAMVFKLHTQSPFSVCPETGILEPGEIFDVKVSYKTWKVDNNTSELVITCEGVDLNTTLMCKSKNCEIYVDKTILYFKDTYFGLSSSVPFNLINKSEYTMKYQWKIFESKYNDMEKSEDYRHKLKDINEYEVLRNIQDENPNITDSELHETFLRRIFNDELIDFDSSDRFLFHDKNFKFIETVGVIGPHSKVHMEVIFFPSEANTFIQRAYLEVTGRETRQPLKMIGTGLGPEVVLNMKVLNVENIFLCAKHQYELIAKNESIIPATLNYCHKPMDFGGSISCTPSEVQISPGRYEKLIIEFCSTTEGQFLEYIRFKIMESGDYVSFLFKGNVICPLLNYDVTELDFGIVPFGFPIEKEITIQNPTEMPIQFSLGILNDGYSEAITWETFSKSHDVNAVTLYPKEFLLYPSEGTINGQGSVQIRLTLIPNVKGKRSTVMRTYMWGNMRHFIELPLFYECKVPTVECVPSRLDIRYCFINCPYDRSFTLKNVSTVPGYILYNDEPDYEGLDIKLSLTESYLEPDEVITIHVEIKATQLGLHTRNISFTVFGDDPNNFCKLSCDVQGPVVCVNPEEIKFGAIQLLKWHKRRLFVMNDSPVPASISISNPNPIFHIVPSDFIVEASEKIQVEISTFLTSISKYSSILSLNIINNSDALRVPVTAVGIGCCILFEPALTPKYDLGTLMTHNLFRKPFKMTNMGKEIQKIHFSHMNNLKLLKDEVPPSKSPPFIIEPVVFEIHENETKSSFIEVFNTTAGPIEMTYYCYNIDKSMKFEKIFDVKLIAKFEDPILSLSKESINFRMDVTIHETTSYLKEIFTVKNESYLALDVNFSLQPPFYLNEDESRCSILYANIPSKADYSFIVEFVPPNEEKKCSLSTGTMKIGFKNNPKIFTVHLNGVVNYPTVLIFPESFTLQDIENFGNSYRCLLVKNISPLAVVYKFELNVSSLSIEKLPSQSNSSSINSSQCLVKFEEKYIEEVDSLQEYFESLWTYIFSNSDVKNEYIIPSVEKMYEIFLTNLRLLRLKPEIRKNILRLCNKVLSPIIQDGDNDFQTKYNRIFETIPQNDTDISEYMLNITPYQGCLEPFECAIIGFFVRPPPQTCIQATVICKILGGAEETIDISAICDNASFYIDTTDIDLGNQLFSEIIERNFVLSNNGRATFEYTVLNDCIQDKDTSGWLSVSPNTGILHAGENVTFSLNYYSGAIGKFEETFNIEIGYLKPLSIRLHGFGVYSQVSINLPRPKLDTEAGIDSCYAALTQLYGTSYIHSDYKLLSEDTELDELEISILQEDGWFIVEFQDHTIPALVDIDMSIERMFAYDFMKTIPYILKDRERSSLKKRFSTIPNFIVPGYELSFGKVRLDGKYRRDIDLYNYGPDNCVVRLMTGNKKMLELKGISVFLEDPKIRVGEITHITVTLVPNMRNFDPSHPHLREEIFVEVHQGAKIPIKITALLGMPQLEIDRNCLDFYGVIVGNAKRSSLCLYNTGFVELRWTCSINSPIFFMRKYEGVLYPGSMEEQYIFFEPKTKGPMEGIITFVIDGSNFEITTHLNGYGLETHIDTKDTCLIFPPMLQYSPFVEESFFIQNSSSFLNEVFLSDYDRHIELQEKIANVYWKLNNPKKVYIARSRFGNTPSEIYRFLFRELMIDKFRKENNHTEELKISREEDIIQAKILYKGWIFSTSQTEGSNVSMETLLDGLEIRAELSEMKEQPPQDIFYMELEEEKIKEHRNTKIIVFHGNMYTDYVKAATEASIQLKIPRYTLDGMIIDILARNSSEFTSEVNEIIDEAYLQRMTSEDCLCRESLIEDKIEEIWRKIHVILNRNPISRPSSVKHPQKSETEKSKQDKSSGFSSVKISKKAIAPVSPDTFQGIAEEMLIQILSDRIDQNDKIIIESLNSIFLPNIQLALRCFLKAARNITDVYFILFSCSYEHHLNIALEDSTQKEKADFERISVVRKRLIDKEDYSNLTGEEFFLLKDLYTERKKSFAHRRTEIRLKILNDMMLRNQEDKVGHLKTHWTRLDKYLPEQMFTVPKTNSKSVKTPLHLPSSGSASKLSKDTKESNSSRGKRPKKENEEKETEVYFKEFNIMLNEIMHLLEYWDRKLLEMTKPIPNFANLRTSDARNLGRNSKILMKKPSKIKFKDAEKSLMGLEESNTDTKVESEIGYPVWLVSEAHRKRRINVVSSIIKLLENIMTKNSSEPSHNTCKNVDEIYTILKKPNNRKAKQKLDVFEIIRSETLVESEKSEVPQTDDESSIINHQSKSYAAITSTSKKRGKKRKLTLAPSVSELSQTTGIPCRFILEPGQIQRISILFKPLYCGTFKYTYFFETIGSNHKGKVEIEACCDYPRIDTSPYTMFPNTVENVDNSTPLSKGIYIISQNTLDFGTVLLVSQNLLEKKSTISMLNISTMTCFISLHFRIDSSIFYCNEKGTIAIEPGMQHSLSIFAKPKHEGVFKDTLLISIKNNPRVQTLFLCVFACSLKFEVYPKTVDFNKVIFGKTESENLTLKNGTNVVIHFEIEYELSSEFEIPVIDGNLDPNTELDIAIKFSPTEIGDRKESLTIKVFDAEKRFPNPINSNVVTIIAEVESFPLEYSEYIDLGLVKGKYPNFFPFRIHNAGRSDVKVIITKPVIFNKNHNIICDYFKMKHTEYIVKGETTNANNCRFICNKAQEFTNAPIANITILDNYRHSVIDSFSLKVSAKVILSSFDLCPYGEYFFGYQYIGTSRSSILTLKNTGTFDFKFTILTPAIVEEQLAKKKIKKEGTVPFSDHHSSIHSAKELDLMKTDSSRTKLTRSSMEIKERRQSRAKVNSRSTAESLEVGVFSISPSSGHVKSNEIFSITIHSRPKESQKYMESIIIFVSEASFQDRKGRILHLHVDGTEPYINFEDQRFMFPEQYITKKIEDLPFIGDNMVFEMDTNSLYFGRVTINNSKKTRLRIPNTGHVTALVHFEIKEKDSDFRVESKSIEVAPYRSQYNSVVFSPKCIGTSKGLLEMRCDGVSSKNAITYRVNLIGDAYMPSIEILKPELSPSGLMQIHFEPIPQKSSAEKEIIFMNNGQVPTKVIIEISNEPMELLSLRPYTELDTKKGERAARQSIIKYLDVGEQGTVLLKFESLETTSLEAELIISIVENCFDIWKIPIIAASFPAEIILKELPINMTSDFIAYVLDFGLFRKREQRKIHFKICNISQFNFKFHFAKFEGLEFYPRTGHLYPDTEKSIIAVFFTRNDLNLKQQNLKINITEIELNPENMPFLPWDDRQDCIIYEDKSEATKETSDSPEQVDEDRNESESSSGIMNNSVNEISQRPEIILLLSAVCSKSEYYCEIRELAYTETDLHQTTEKSFTVENKGRTDLEISWSFPNSSSEECLLNKKDRYPSLFEKLHIHDTCAVYPIQTESQSRCEEAFNIDPQKFSIRPGEVQVFNVIFRPIHNKIYKCIAKANMKNLDGETPDLEIILKGETRKFPYQFQSTNFGSIKRCYLRFGSYCGYVAEENAFVSHFLSLGTRNECKRTINIWNDTESAIYYIWEKVMEDQEKSSFFHSEIKKGYIPSGRMTSNDFIFIPQYQGTFTDVYKFVPVDKTIPTSSILMHGICRNPKVYFEHPFITFDTTILNKKVRKNVFLINDEDEKLRFKFRKSSLSSSNQQILSVSPNDGILEAKGKCEISFSCGSTICGETIFNPTCAVQYMKEPITLNIFSNVIKVSCSLFHYERELIRRKIQPNIINIINLGIVIPHKEERIKFDLQNDDEIGFYFIWSTENKQSKSRINFSQQNGFLTRYEKTTISVSITALKKCTIKNVVLKLQVLHGPCYTIRLEASSKKPLYTFSFLKYDFKKCLIQKKPGKFYETTLVFTNNNSWNVVLEKETNFSSAFSIDFKSDLVNSNRLKTMQILFNPTEIKKYREKIIFLVNSRKTSITLNGEGVPLIIDVLNLNDKFLDFGSVRVGRSLQKCVKILNAGEAAVDVHFDIYERLSLPKMDIDIDMEEFRAEKPSKSQPTDIVDTSRKTSSIATKPIRVSKDDNKSMKMSTKDKVSRSMEKKKMSEKASYINDKRKLSDKASNYTSYDVVQLHMESKMSRVKNETLSFILESIEVLPKKRIKIPPGKMIDLVIRYSPKKCQKDFETKIFYEVQNYVEPLITILGSSKDAVFRLNKDVINYGNVITGYSSEASIVLINEGCIGGRFKWFLEKNTSYITFVDGEGYSPPNSNVITKILFKPGHVQCIFKFKAYCKIENYSERLYVLLTGGSMCIPPPMDTIHFTSCVRDEAYNKIEFTNDSNESWTTQPVFTGMYFSGAEHFEIPKQSTVSYKITYSPLKMSNNIHKGTVFFPLPSGFSKLYSLEGTPSSPKPQEEISRQIFCKTYHTEYLKVVNWLGIRQQFRVLTEVIEGDTSRMIYKITSNDWMELPPYSTREFKWTIYVVNEGHLSMKVTFMNDKTKEYIYYHITLRISNSDNIMESLSFTTCVRIPVMRKLQIKNPLGESLEYSTSTTSPFIVVENKFVVPPHGKYELAVKYMPLKIESTTASLLVNNPQVGLYQYNLILDTQAANSEPETKFCANLGKSIMKLIYIPRILSNGTINIKLPEKTVFEVAKINNVGEKPSIEVSFEPSRIGIIRETMEVISPFGEYTFPMIGESLQPEPQGPLILRYGDTTHIEFKNPLEENLMYQFYVDNKIFHVKPAYETLRGRKSTKLTLSTGHRSNRQSGSSAAISKIFADGDVMGKLFIVCEHERTSFKWIYYLQCTLSNK